MTHQDLLNKYADAAFVAAYEYACSIDNEIHDICVAAIQHAKEHHLDIPAVVLEKIAERIDWYEDDQQQERWLRLKQDCSSQWEYDRTIQHQGKEYILWKRPHLEGYTAYQLTHSRTEYPVGSGHYTSLEALSRTTGIKL